MSRGYKTYLLIKNNLALAYPCHRKVAPPHIEAIKDDFYVWKFGTNYIASESLVRFPTSHGAVKGDLATPKEKDLENADVRHFLAMNPDYQKGVELACIAEIRIRDLFVVFYRQFILAGILNRSRSLASRAWKRARVWR